MNIYNYIQDRGFSVIEGHCQDISEQLTDLANLVKDINIKNVLEIGFNAGCSAEVFLYNNPNINLVSFDLGVWNYVPIAKEYIDYKYTGRHRLILGDSTKTIPLYNNELFDMIFIDGGHDNNIPQIDLNNCLRLAHKDTIVIMDDVVNKEGWEKLWTIGPTQAWNEGLASNRIIEIQRKEYSIGRGMVWGKYNL
jgi:predicted O-methyltransferase YrrM